MFRRLSRRGLVTLSACSLALATATPAYAATQPSWQTADVLGPVNGGSEIWGLAPTGAQNAWAAGVYSKPAVDKLLVAQWNGTGWQQVALPTSVTRFVKDPGSAVVGASSATNAMVFANGGNGNYDYAYEAAWNGSTWTTHRFATWSAISATEVFSATDAWAFGSLISPSGPYDLHYNGKTWRKVALPIMVDGVSATSASNMWIFGLSTTSPSTPLVMHWNGKSWSTFSLPSLHLGTGEFLVPGTIATLSPTDVWVASALGKGMGLYPGYVLLHWNGKAWQRVKIPYPTETVGYLAQDGAGGFWLTANDDNSTFTPYFYHDTGSGTWSEQEAPAEGSQTTQLAAISWVPGTTTEWAGGEILPGTGTSQAAIFGYGN